MNFKVLILIIFCCFVGGCGHLQEPYTGNASANGTAKTESVLATPTITHQPTIIDKTETPTTTVLMKPTPVIIQSNLLDRIRSGFRLPELASQHTSHYEKWNAKHTAYLESMFARAEPFLFHIIEEIEKRNLPTELALLPAIESAYKPNATSRSGAGGLWQFIPSTGRAYGLRQDRWYDGRRDALASTTAALDYLVELNAMFDGDWFLTLAAYNAGQGTLFKAIKANKRRSRNTDFQSLNLRSETERYVPKLIALRNVILNPGKFNVNLPNIPNRQHFQVVSLPGQANLKTFSEQAGVDYKALLHLNAGHRRDNTTPDGPHRLLVPLTASAKVPAALQHINNNPIAQYQYYHIRPGDSLSRIAGRYGVSINSLKRANNIRGSAIHAGQKLLVPNTGESLALNSGASSNSYAQKKVTHRVVRGDTLWSISKKYQVRVAQLLSWNKMSSNQILSLGQSLFVFDN